MRASPNLFPTRCEQVLQRVVQIALGYADQNDARWLRDDSLIKIACDLAMGRVYATRNPAGTIYREYDDFGRTKRLEQQLSADVLGGMDDIASTYTARFQYGRQGDLYGVEFVGLGGEAQLGYERDALGRVSRVVSKDNVESTTLVEQIDYDAHNAVTRATLGNGNSVQWSFMPARHLLESIEHQDATQDVFSKVSYTAYDANDNLLEEQRTGEASEFYSGKMHSYDALDRLKQSTVDLRTRAFSEDYVYSAGGNIDTASNESYTYENPRLPQAVTSIDVSQTPVRRLQYDQNGRMVQQDAFEPGEGALGDRETTVEVQYDAAGCMTQIDRETWTLDYNGNPSTMTDKTTRHVCGEGGRRVLRETTDHLSGQKSRVIDFAGLAEIRPDEGIMLWRVPVNGAVTVEEARSLADGTRDIAQSGYLHTDVRGSTLAKTGWDAQMSLPFEEAEYGAWGETLSVSDVHGPPTHQFVGFEPDPATGWYFMGARVYDPTLRRWLSPDPLMLANPEINTGEGIELNLYSYAGNNPIIYIDPDGTCRRNGKKIDCFSAAWKKYTAHMAATEKNVKQGNYGTAAGSVPSTFLHVGAVAAAFAAQGPGELWNAGVDAYNANYGSAALSVGMAIIPAGKPLKMAAAATKAGRRKLTEKNR